MVGAGMRCAGVAALAIAALFAVVAGAGAAPIGRVEPFSGRWRVGGEIGFTIDRDLDAVGRPGARFEVDRRFSYLGRVSYGLLDDWEVYGRVGFVQLGFFDASNVGDTGTSSTNYYDMGEELAWGFGGRGIVWHDAVPGWDVAVDAQFLEHVGDDGQITRGPGVGTIVNDIDYREWSIAVLFQTEYRTLRPYVGPIFGDVTIGGAGLDLSAGDHVGLVVGTGWESGGWTGFVEGRLVDETAVNAGLVWMF